MWVTVWQTGCGNVQEENIDSGFNQPDKNGQSLKLGKGDVGGLGQSVKFSKHLI